MPDRDHVVAQEALPRKTPSQPSTTAHLTAADRLRYKGRMTRQKPEELVAIALRGYAKRMMDSPDQYPTEEARNLDRALRSCKAISDIDVIWVRWSFVAEPRGWTTSDEMRHGSRGYYYPGNT
jgi:hypothetical protein